MTAFVVSGATITCTFGTVPTTLTVLPEPATAGAMPIARITDTGPIVNVSSFTMCRSPANPAVQAATAAASGVFTPAPCVPATGTPWAPPSRAVTIGGVPAVPQTATCNCQWGGVIRVTQPGQARISGN